MIAGNVSNYTSSWRRPNNPDDNLAELGVIHIGRRQRLPGVILAKPGGAEQ